MKSTRVPQHGSTSTDPPPYEGISIIPVVQKEPSTVSSNKETLMMIMPLFYFDTVCSFPTTTSYNCNSYKYCQENLPY